MAIPTVHRAMASKIIEAASATIDFVVKSICSNPAPPGFTYNASWASRYEALVDLNVISPVGNDHLKNSPEHIDRYPACAFFIDEVIRQPEAEELATASLGIRIECQGETFAIGQLELHEIHHAIRSVLAIDKSLGGLTGRGGLVDYIVWSSMQDLSFFEDEMERPVVAANFFFMMKYTEVEIYQ